MIKAPRASLTVLPWLIWAAVIAASIFLVVYASKAHGQEFDGRMIAQTPPGEIQISLYAQKCAIEGVVNLPARAVWVQGDKTIEGCFGVDPHSKLVTLYFANKTAFSLFAAAFHAVVST